MRWHRPAGNGTEPNYRYAALDLNGDQPLSESTLIVLPTYQEVENISPLIHGLRQAMPLATILVVDDGSPDGTAEVVDELARHDTRITLERRPRKLGLGTAHRLGFEYAMHNGFRTVLTMDADLSHRPVDAPRLVARAREPGVDVAVGSRYVSGGRIEGWPASRRALSFCANLLLRMALGAGVRDCTGAFRAYDVAFLRRLQLDHLENTGYSAIPEELLLASLEGGTLAEEPITFVERQMGATKLTKRELSNSLRNVWRMYSRRRLAHASGAVRVREAELQGRAVSVGARTPSAGDTELVTARHPETPVDR